MDAATGSWAAEAWMMWEAGSKGGKLGLQAVAHARILLGERPALKKSSHRERGLGGNLRDRARPPEHGVPEVETRPSKKPELLFCTMQAAAMLSAVLLRLPDLWSELAQDKEA